MGGVFYDAALRAAFFIHLFFAASKVCAACRRGFPVRGEENKKSHACGILSCYKSVYRHLIETNKNIQNCKAEKTHCLIVYHIANV